MTFHQTDKILCILGSWIVLLWFAGLSVVFCPGKETIYIWGVPWCVPLLRDFRRYPLSFTWTSECMSAQGEDTQWMYLNQNLSENPCKNLCVGFVSFKLITFFITKFLKKQPCPIWFLVFLASLGSSLTMYCSYNFLQFDYVVLGISGFRQTVQYLGFSHESLGTQLCQGHITSNNLFQEYPNMWFWHC